MVGAEEGRAAIWRWDGSRIRRAFVYPRGESRFKAIDVGGGAVWVAGWLSEGGDQKGILVRRAGGEWEEVTTVPDMPLGFSYVAAEGPAGCWLANPARLFHYHNGAWVTFAQPASGGGAGGVTRQRGGAIFAWREYDPDIWAFDGSGWRREDFDRPPDFYRAGFVGGASGAARSFFLSHVYRSDVLYATLFRRDDAPAGEGSYELLYNAPHGPYFYRIDDFTFADDDNGVAVGYLTSVVWEDGEPHQEICDESFKIPYAVAALAPGEYWMLSEDEEGRRFLWRWKK